MNTLYITQSGRVLINENGEVQDYKTSIESIRNISLLKEDTKVVCNFGFAEKVVDAKAGDIVVTFYTEEFPNPIIVVNSPEWKENIETFNKNRQQEKEKWAQAQSLSDKIGDTPEMEPSR